MVCLMEYLKIHYAQKIIIYILLRWLLEYCLEIKIEH
jgi:GH25 family lysozyme M1 (1,4-beta-N-acetylmuramidase)